MGNACHNNTVQNSALQFCVDIIRKCTATDYITAHLVYTYYI